MNLQSGFIKVFLIPQSLSWHLLSLKHASLESRSEIKEPVGMQASKMGFWRSVMTLEPVFSVCSLNLRHREINLCLTLFRRPVIIMKHLIILSHLLFVFKMSPCATALKLT